MEEAVLSSCTTSGPMMLHYRLLFGSWTFFSAVYSGLYLGIAYHYGVSYCTLTVFQKKTTHKVLPWKPHRWIWGERLTNQPAPYLGGNW